MRIREGLGAAAGIACAALAALALPVANAADCGMRIAESGLSWPDFSNPHSAFHNPQSGVPTDLLQAVGVGQVRLSGYLGGRVAANVRGRLLRVDEAALLAGFQRRPGQQAWVGEHVGKWLDAASLAWSNSRDPALRVRLERVAGRLMAAQEADGYLGTYAPPQRFGLFEGADWDVWVHKYCLLGLLSYERATDDRRALAAARRAADLLAATFGAGGRSILGAGTHCGMAATSVLEPVVLLHRATGEGRYLEFARQLRTALEEPGGSELLRRLAEKRPVSEIGGGKAYELLSNLVGVCELSRETGDRRLLAPVQAAWEDIVARRLYLTGTTSAGEHFRGDHQLPNNNAAHVGETCVTTTWIQLNAQLLRLTGEARYGDQIERAVYNHLLAAQSTDGTRWCAYTPLQGAKWFTSELCCCLSSGPRAVALLPALAYFGYRQGREEGIAVNLFERSQFATWVGGRPVTLEQATEFPRRGYTRLTVRCAAPARFGLRVRMPAWTERFEARRPGSEEFKPAIHRAGESGWWDLPPRQWRDGETVEFRVAMGPRLVAHDPANPGRAAAMWGPLALALEEGPAGGREALRTAVFQELAPSSGATPGEAGSLRIPVSLVVRGAPPRAVPLAPFAEAGAGGGHFEVWLHAPGTRLAANPSLLAAGHESRSRVGGGWGEIVDGDPATFAATFNGRMASEDWYSVSLPAPVSVRRVVYAHGQTFPNGGWFDASAGKPRIQALRDWNGRWEDVASVASYPATTAADPRGLKSGDSFTVRLPRLIAVVALRIIGRPACGINPGQAFSTCAELQAFGE